MEVHPSGDEHWSAVCDLGRELQYFYNNISTPFFPKTTEKPNHYNLQEGIYFVTSVLYAYNVNIIPSFFYFFDLQCLDT